MKKLNLTKIFAIIIFSLALITPWQPIKAQASYRPDLLIGYDTTINYAGGGVYNTDGTDQTLYRILQDFRGNGYRLKVVNAGAKVDRLLVSGSATNDYWTITYFDATGRDITSQVNGSGWYTASLPAGAGENLSMKIEPKKTLSYGQESVFYVKTVSASSALVDLVKVVLTIRFNVAGQTGTTNQEGLPPVGPGSPTGSNNPESGAFGRQPDLEIKTADESTYIGRGIFEKPDAVVTQVKSLTTNSAFNPAVFDFKVTNIDAQTDIFAVKGSGQAADWTENYFIKNGEQWQDISAQMPGEYRFTLAPGKSQEYKVEINISSAAENQSFAEFAVAAYSVKDLNKIDAGKFKIIVNNDLDNDSMADNCEVKYGLNPKDPSDAKLDSDGDFVSNKDECAIGTNPKDKDTDKDGLWDGAYVEATKLILPGLSSEHFVIVGPTRNAKGDVLLNQTVTFVLNDPTDTKNTFTMSSNQEGMLIFQIKNDFLSKPGGYVLQTTGNGKVFQENNFFLNPYGYVYNKKTRDPLSGVRVNLWRCSDTCCQYYTSTLTDQDGLYQGFMLPEGNYRIKVNEPNFQSFLSKPFALTKDGNKQDIWLTAPTPPWLVILYLVLGIIAVIIILIIFFKLKGALANKEYVSYQPDAQIKNSTDAEDEYLGDTVYNLDGLGQTKDQEITKKQTAVFHLRLQNDGRATDKFIVQAYPPAKGWGTKFFNVVEGGNEITAQVLGTGWEGGNLASGVTKDIRLEVWVKDESALDSKLYDLPIQLTSINDPTKSDVVKARVKLIDDKKIETAQPPD